MSQHEEMLFQKWRKQLDAVHTELSWLYWDRMMYKRVLMLIEQQDWAEHSADHSNWVLHSYFVSACATIRRLLDNDQRNKPESLGVLITSICSNAHIVTRERFVSLYQACLQNLGYADMDFDRYAGSGGEILDRAILSSWYQSAMKASKTVTAYVDRMVAHHDRTPPEILPTCECVEKAIAAASWLFVDLDLLLKSDVPDLVIAEEYGTYHAHLELCAMAKFAMPSTPLMYWDRHGNEVLIQGGIPCPRCDLQV